ncbi:DUF4345 family protein [Planktotalea arctica]|uniref:DUF4345 family protein n=1 Tax=Planktotalea arctica TaxID=1481893 RepID=UPI003219A5E9
MIDTLNIAAALLTIGFGSFGFLAPRFTASALDLHTGETTMGLSELRASVGCLFVALGLFCLIWPAPMAFSMMGVAYAGAAFGRLTSLALDKPPFTKAFIYFAIEALLAAYLLLANL